MKMPLKSMESLYIMSKKLLEYLYSSGGTRRYHNRPKVDQNVKEHSWGVALTITILHPNPSANLLKAATLHDCSEKVYGDFLSPAKIAFPELRELDKKCNDLFWNDIATDTGITYPTLTDEEQLWLNFADMYECYLFAREEGIEDIIVDGLNRANAIADELRKLGYEI